MLKITELFNIGDASTPGGCQGKEDIMDFWATEVVLLHNAIKKAYNDYQTDRGLRYVWESVFGLLSKPDGSLDYTTDIIWQSWSKIGGKFLLQRLLSPLY